MRHQQAALEESLGRREFALFFEQRCGKTKVVIDTASYHFQCGTIDTVIVIAWPNGVQHVWAEEWPKDWPNELPYKLIAWRSGKMQSATAKEQLRALWAFDGLAVLTMNCEAMATDWGEKVIRGFIERRKGTLLVADESSWAKAPNSARTKRLLALGRMPNVKLKRILDGTPADEGPFDLYSPCAFLNPDLLGFQNFYFFKMHHAVMVDGFAAGGRRFKQVVGYRNLEELNRKLSTFSHRVRRADVSDAPPKLYESRYFQMSDTQQAVYNDLRDEYIAHLSDVKFPVAEVLKRMTRLQMVARNYWPPEEGGEPCPYCIDTTISVDCEHCGGLGVAVTISKLERIDPDVNPAQEALTSELASYPGPTVIWARFRQDVTDALEASAQAGRKAVRFDGSVPSAEREEAYRAFRAGEADDIVATIRSGLSRGRDLTRARAMIYYSNEFSLRARRQSEDRAESLGRTFSTDVIDLIAEGTRDVDVITALREKKSIAEIIVGDPAEKWI